MSFKSKLEKLEARIMKTSNYSQIIRKHAIEHKEGYGKDEGMLVHVIMGLYITSHPEHKRAVKARNFLEWINGQSFNAIPRAYAAIKDFIAAGLATVMPREFISDGRDVSMMIPPYPYLCSPEQILHYADSRDNQFWTDL